MAFDKINFKKNFFILGQLISRDFKLKFRRSVLGVAWSVLNPLLMMVVMSLVFSNVFRFNILHFPVYLILGLTLFNLMSNSTSSAVKSIINAAGLIKKVRVNKLIFPIQTVLFELINFGLSLIAVFLVMVWFWIFPSEKDGPMAALSLNVLYLPLLISYVLVFSMGISFLLSSLAVFFRDVIHLWGVVIIAWTYLTPLFYPVEGLPSPMPTVMEFNPMYHYITYFRDIMMNATSPGLMENLICAGMAILTFAIGLLVFRKTERKFILHV